MFSLSGTAQGQQKEALLRLQAEYEFPADSDLKRTRIDRTMSMD